LKLLVDPEIPVEIRSTIVQNLQSAFYRPSTIGDADAALLLRAARGLTGSGSEDNTLRTLMACMAVQQISAPSESWDEFQRYLSSETNDTVRSSVLKNFFAGFSRRKGYAAAEALLLETLQGRYGSTALQAQLDEPLLPWFSAGNAEAFVGTLRQTAAQVGTPAQRQAVAGQLGLLYLIRRHEGALGALRQLAASETEDAVRSRLGEVIQAAEKGTLDVDNLMEKLELQWNF
jgi:hypothetical protein